MADTDSTLEAGTCSGCKAAIFWGVTVKGKKVPLNPPENRYVLNAEGRMLMVKTYVGHHATCPDVAHFRNEGT